MTTHEHIDQEELMLYALQFLPDREAAEIRQHLEECTGCDDAVALIRGDLAAFALTADMHSPPSSARQRLMTQVARERKIVPIDRVVYEDSSPLSNRLLIDDSSLPERSSNLKILPWVSWTGWAVAAGLTIAAVDLYKERDDLRSDVARQAGQMASLSVDAEKGRTLVSALTDAAAVRVVLTQTAAKALPQGRASYLPEKGSLIFTASNLAPLQPYKTYELWLIPADGHDPIPAGTFRPDERGYATVIMPDLPKGVIAKAFGVTIEDEGGSQQPTLPIILSGA
jgi:anti-sigma-K factor RskA